MFSHKALLINAFCAHSRGSQYGGGLGLSNACIMRFKCVFVHITYPGRVYVRRTTNNKWDGD
jgi:hypothetical protein